MSRRYDLGICSTRERVNPRRQRAEIERMCVNFAKCEISTILRRNPRSSLKIKEVLKAKQDEAFEISISIRKDLFTRMITCFMSIHGNVDRYAYVL